MSSTHDCCICGGCRPKTGTHCCGCGSPLQLCRATSKVEDRRWQCPKCRDKRYVHVGSGRVSCVGCYSEFELTPDVGFVDSRPEVNAEKREEFQQRQQQRNGRAASSPAAVQRFRRL